MQDSMKVDWRSATWGLIVAVAALVVMHLGLGALSFLFERGNLPEGAIRTSWSWAADITGGLATALASVIASGLGPGARWRAALGGGVTASVFLVYRLMADAVVGWMPNLRLESAMETSERTLVALGLGIVAGLVISHWRTRGAA